MNLFEKTLSQTYHFKGRVVNLRLDEIELPNGKEAKREVVEHPGGVCVLAINDENNILMVKQFRYPFGEAIIEIPAGKLEKGEDPFECGKRELKEETGVTAGKYTFLGEMYATPAYCEEIIYIYLAQELKFGEQHLDTDEFLEVFEIPLEKALQMVLSNEIKDAKTQIAILKAHALLSGLGKESD